MNLYAIVNGINSLCALSIVLILLFKKAREPIHLTFGFFSLLIFFWTFFYFIWGLQTTEEAALFWQHMLHYATSFVHVAYLHFVLVFSDNKDKYKKHLLIGYLLSFIFSIFNYNYLFFEMDHVRPMGPFPFWPHATIYLNLFIAMECYYVLVGFFVLVRSIRKSEEPLKTRLKLFLVFGLLGWLGGLTNWFYFYDSTPIPPVGNPIVTIYLIATFYLIFKHDMLNLNIVTTKAFVYALLTLFITLTYTILIIISERTFQTFLGYESIVITVAAAATIALLFNPLRLVLTRTIDKAIFGKNIEELSSENLLMKGELVQHDKMRSVATLAAGMAHEIKNPLTSIKTFTEHLPKKHRDPEFIEKFKSVVQREVDNIDSIVKELLEFAKPSPLTLQKVDIQLLIKDVLTFLNNDFVKKKIVLETQFDRSSVFVRGDKKQLEQVFINLFLNAVQSMPKGGKLSVYCGATPDHNVRVRVSDTGSGIAKEHLDRIFDPFFTTKDAGTGLGLATVQSVIANHGGVIRVKSEVGQGTTFSVFLKSLA